MVVDGIKYLLRREPSRPAFGSGLKKMLFESVGSVGITDVPRLQREVNEALRAVLPNRHMGDVRVDVPHRPPEPSVVDHLAAVGDPGVADRLAREAKERQQYDEDLESGTLRMNVRVTTFLAAENIKFEVGLVEPDDDDAP